MKRYLLIILSSLIILLFSGCSLNLNNSVSVDRIDETEPVPDTIKEFLNLDLVPSK